MVVVTAMLVMIGLLAPGAASAVPTRDGAQERQSGPAAERGQSDRPRTEAPPIIGWLVVVAVRGAASSLKVGVRGRTAAAARQAARQQAEAAGYVVESLSEPVKGDYRTAGGFQIRVGDAPQRKHGFGSYRAFLKRWKGAGAGREWHHIVERKAIKPGGGNFPQWQLHNRLNLISIRRDMHQKCINSHMGTKLKNMNRRDRDALRIRVVPANREHTLRFEQRNYSYENQHLFGLRLLKHCGVFITGSGI